MRRSAAALESGFSSAARRALRQAAGRGVTTAVSYSHEAVRTYYALHRITRHRHGAPPQPFSFFHHLFEQAIDRRHGFVMLASVDGQAVAGAVFLHAGRRAIYKFGASLPAASAPRANHRIMADAIFFLAAAGWEELHFGRTSLGQEGLRRFKLSFGAREEPLPYYRLGVPAAGPHPRRERSSGLSAALFRRLPLSLNRLAGRLLYPHLD